MGPYLLQNDLKYGPLFCMCFIKVSYWACKDSEFGAHTGGRYLLWILGFQTLSVSSGLLQRPSYNCKRIWPHIPDIAVVSDTSNLRVHVIGLYLGMYICIYKSSQRNGCHKIRSVQARVLGLGSLLGAG